MSNATEEELEKITKYAEIIGLTLFASIACNLLYNYIKQKKIRN